MLCRVQLTYGVGIQIKVLGQKAVCNRMGSTRQVWARADGCVSVGAACAEVTREQPGLRVEPGQELHLRQRQGELVGHGHEQPTEQGHAAATRKRAATQRQWQVRLVSDPRCD